MKYAVDDHLAAVYEGTWFIGEIVDKDADEYEVKFMESKKLLFQWPRHKDIVWMKPGEIPTRILAPQTTGKSKRMYKLGENDRECVMNLYAVYMYVRK